jgi:hypothetical protein
MSGGGGKKTREIMILIKVGKRDAHFTHSRNIHGAIIHNFRNILDSLLLLPFTKREKAKELKLK